MKSKALREKILPTHHVSIETKSGKMNGTNENSSLRPQSSRAQSTPRQSRRSKKKTKTSSSTSSSSTVHSGEVETINGIRIVMTSLVLYAILFLVTLAALASTYYAYPLYPIQPKWLDWSNAWIIGWMINYYGTCLCFCGVVLSEENGLRVGLAWCIGFLTLGSPVACLWMVVWLARRAGGNWTQ